MNETMNGYDAEEILTEPTVDLFPLQTVADVEDCLEQIHALEAEIKAAESKRDDSIAYHQSRIEKAKQICEQETKSQREEITRITAFLEHYFDGNPPERGKSIKFSGGTLSKRAQPTKFFFKNGEVKSDSPELIAFTRTYHNEFLKRKEFVDWSNFKKQLAVDGDGTVFMNGTGEILYGFRAEAQPDKFSVMTND